MNNEILDEIKRLKSIADIGLLYCNNEYDKERYLELQEITLEMLSKVSGHSVDTLKETFPIAKDYPTAKVDIRGLILSGDKRILLIKESEDGKWVQPIGSDHKRMQGRNRPGCDT
jgi:Hydrolase of X-linked nucleoside diphosphate N terminal